MAALPIDELTAAIVAFMRGATTAGRVEDRPRSTVTPEQMARLLTHSGTFGGWIPRYHFSTERQGPEIGRVTVTHRFGWTFITPYDDDRSDGETSAAYHARMYAEMAAVFRLRRSFGYGRARVENQLLQSRGAARIEDSETKGRMLVGEATLDVVEYVDVVGC